LDETVTEKDLNDLLEVFNSKENVVRKTSYSTENLNSV